MIGRTRNSDEETVKEMFDNAVVTCINMTLVIDHNNNKVMKMPILRDLHFFFIWGVMLCILSFDMNEEENECKCRSY